jgi:hypothetical protein
MFRKPAYSEVAQNLNAFPMGLDVRRDLKWIAKRVDRALLWCVTLHVKALGVRKYSGWAGELG